MPTIICKHCFTDRDAHKPCDGCGAVAMPQQVVTFRSGDADDHGTLLATFPRAEPIKTIKLIEFVESIQYDGCIDEIVIACEQWSV